MDWTSEKQESWFKQQERELFDENNDNSLTYLSDILFFFLHYASIDGHVGLYKFERKIRHCYLKFCLIRLVDGFDLNEITDLEEFDVSNGKAAVDKKEIDLINKGIEMIYNACGPETFNREMKLIING